MAVYLCDYVPDEDNSSAIYSEYLTMKYAC